MSVLFTNNIISKQVINICAPEENRMLITCIFDTRFSY